MRDCDSQSVSEPLLFAKREIPLSCRGGLVDAKRAAAMTATKTITEAKENTDAD